MTDPIQRLHDIRDRLDLPTYDPESVADEVAALVANPGLDDGVEDLEDLPFVTIDNLGSRDLDQALFVERAQGGWWVRYALADAAYYVRPGTRLFDLAARQGATFYFPSFSLPMLPRQLSEGIVSLNPHVARRALVFDMFVDDAGEVSRSTVRRARIRSRAKLTYDGVQRHFDAPGSPKDPVSGHEFEASLGAFAEVGELRIARARSRGMIEFERSELEVDIERNRFVVVQRRRNDVERWNEQISLMCNTEGAAMLRRLEGRLDDLQSVYRVHLPPLERRLEELERDIATIAKRHDLPDEWRWSPPESLAAYLVRLPEEPAAVRRAIDRQVRYTNRASEFSDRHGPHYALAVEQYARFSSPMREAVGIFTHNELLEALDLQADAVHDDGLRARVIEHANDAKNLQKKIDREVVLQALHDQFAAELRQRPWHQGTIIGLRATRLYVLIDDPPLEVKVYTEDLEAQVGGGLELDGIALRGEDVSFGVGDSLRLRVREYDTAARRWRFEVERSG